MTSHKDESPWKFDESAFASPQPMQPPRSRVLPPRGYGFHEIIQNETDHHEPVTPTNDAQILSSTPVLQSVSLQPESTAVETEIEHQGEDLRQESSARSMQQLRAALRRAVNKITMLNAVTKISVTKTADNQRVGIKLAISSSKGARIKDLIPGGLAAESGKFKVGDYIVKINGQSVRGLPDTEVNQLVAASTTLDFETKSAESFNIGR